MKENNQVNDENIQKKNEKNWKQLPNYQMHNKSLLKHSKIYLCNNIFEKKNKIWLEKLEKFLKNDLKNYNPFFFEKKIKKIMCYIGQYISFVFS